MQNSRPFYNTDFRLNYKWKNRLIAVKMDDRNKSFMHVSFQFELLTSEYSREVLKHHVKEMGGGSDRFAYRIRFKTKKMHFLISFLDIGSMTFYTIQVNVVIKYVQFSNKISISRERELYF